jgi:dynein heavy chain 1
MSLIGEYWQIMLEMAEIEPILERARSAVNKVTKQHLEELRSMNNPPSSVKWCLEAVALLLLPEDEHPMSWDGIRKMSRRDDFIQKILEFDAILQFPPATRMIIRTEYFSQAGFNVAALEYASKACGK